MGATSLTWTAAAIAQTSREYQMRCLRSGAGVNRLAGEGVRQLPGLGLSITYRDVRIVSDILKAAPDWAHADFRPFGEERRERMRRLRFAAHLQAALDMEFGTRARARRQRYHDMMLTDPSIGLHGMAVMAGPETAPAEIFTPEHRARVLGEEVTA
jgi:hypothetical protein